MLKTFWDFPPGPVVNSELTTQEAEVLSLVRELGSCMLCSQNNK